MCEPRGYLPERRRAREVCLLSPCASLGAGCRASRHFTICPSLPCFNKAVQEMSK
jgi:hypothetical protein